MKRLYTRQLALLFLALPCLARADALLDQTLSKPGKSDAPPTIYLGTVAVGGKTEILEALQDIKVALDQPFSNDPKLADVVVCRLSDDIGTHAKQLLICATNRELAKNKELLQTLMSASLADADAPSGGDNVKGSSTACASGSCYETTVSILNQSIESNRRHYLKQQVNGPSLHALLQSIPYPQAVQPAPAPGTVTAPAPATAHV
jgi:hypothetical protein